MKKSTYFKLSPACQLPFLSKNALFAKKRLFCYPHASFLKRRYAHSLIENDNYGVVIQSLEAKDPVILRRNLEERNKKLESRVIQLEKENNRLKDRLENLSIFMKISKDL